MPPHFLQPPGAPLATLGGIVGLLLAGFLWDLTTPLGYVPWLLYLPTLLLTLALPYRWDAPALAGLCTLLILSAHLSSPLKGGGNPQAALFNRTLGIAILWLMAGTCLLYKRAEDRLRKNDTRFRVIFEQAAVGVAQIETATGRFVRVNQRYCEIVGLSAERMTAATFMDLTYAEDLQENLDNMARLVAGETHTFTMDKRYVRPDGSVVWVTLTVSPMWAPGERPDYHIAVVEDITARKRAEEKLDLVYKELQDILDSAPAMIWYKDKENRILRANKPAAESIGLSPQEVAGRSTYDLYPEEAAKYHADDLDVIRSGQPKLGIVEPYQVGREMRWLRTDKIPYRNETGEITGVVVFAQDITDRKRAETELRLTQFAMNYSSEGMFVVDADGRILAANDTVCRRLEYSRDELLTMTIPDIDPLFPRERWPAHWQELKTAGRLVIETINRTKSGRTFPVQVSIAYLPWANEECCCSIITDITERHRAEQRQMGHRLVLEMLATGQPLTLVLETLVRNTEAQAPGILGSVLLLDKEGRRLTHGAAPSLPPDYCRAVDGIEIGPEVGSCGTAAYRRATVIVEDIATDPLWRHSREVAQQYGLAACWSKPICSSDGRVLGTFAMYYRETRAPRPDELALLDAAVQVAAIAIERKQAEEQLTQSHEQLQALTAHLESVREDERARIARELHDDLGQTLTGLKMDLASLTKSLTPPFTNFQTSRALAKLDDMQMLLSVSIQGIRRMVLELRPPVLDHLGLDGALEWLAHDFQKRHGILCKFHSAGSFDTIDASVATALFRIAQEAQTNVSLHANAATMLVELAHEERHLRLTVTDDGIGLNEADVTKPTSFGLIGIQERVRLLGGTVAFQGRRGRGTRVIVRIPWEAAS
jgi:PAS domain S-box-containing protein